MTSCAKYNFTGEIKKCLAIYYACYWWVFRVFITNSAQRILLWCQKIISTKKRKYMDDKIKL